MNIFLKESNLKGPHTRVHFNIRLGYLLLLCFIVLLPSRLFYVVCIGRNYQQVLSVGVNTKPNGSQF